MFRAGLTILVLLASTTAFAATPDLGTPYSSGPYYARTDSGRPVVIATPGAMLMAWSEVTRGASRIHLQRLELDGAPTGSRVELPTVDPRSNAVAPALASDGTRVLVAWHEWADGAVRAETSVVFVDPFGTMGSTPATLRPLDLPIPFGVPARRSLVTSWNGTEFVVSSGNTRWRLNQAGLVVAAESPAGGGDAVAAGATGETFIATSSYTGPSCFVSGLLGICHPIPEESGVSWRLLRGSTTVWSGGEQRRGVRGGLPSIAARPSDALVVWQQSSYVEVFRIAINGQVVERRSFAVPPWPFDASPTVAFDGRRYLAVWRTESGIQAVTLDQNGWSDMFAIPAAPHGKAGIFAVAPGRFLVVWSSVLTETSHGWRTITFEPQPVRRRSVR